MADLAEAMRRGLAPDSPALDAPLARHLAWVTAQWPGEAGVAAYARLADVYRHPDFVARDEAIAPGFTEYLRGDDGLGRATPGSGGAADRSPAYRFLRTYSTSAWSSIW